MKIRITGVQEAVQKLHKVGNGIEGALSKTRQDLAKMGEDIINQEYANSDGNDGYETSILDTGKSTILEVVGEDVGFIEFGAGVYTTMNEFSGEVDYPVYDGSYSDSNNGSYSRNGFWYYNGQSYVGIEPRPGVAMAYETMLNSAERVLKDNIQELVQ